jgi:hypothetical protein
MEAVCFRETLVYKQDATWHKNPEDHPFFSPHHENLIFYIFSLFHNLPPIFYFIIIKPMNGMKSNNHNTDRALLYLDHKLSDLWIITDVKYFKSCPILADWWTESIDD